MSLLLLLRSTAVRGTVTFDAVGPSSAGATAVGASLSWTHTATGANLYVVVGIAVDGNPDTTATVTYGGTTMASLGKVYANGGVGGYAQLFGLGNAPAGASTVAVSLSATPAFGIDGGSVSFAGVHPSAPVNAPVTSFGQGGAASVALPATSTGSMVVDVIAAGSALSAPSLTNRWLRNLSNAHFTAANAAQSTAAGGAAVTSSYTVSPGDTWAMLAVEVQPADVAPSTAATASGSITLGGSSTALVAASASGTVTLGATASGRAPASAAGSLSLGGAATASAPTSPTGSVTLGGATTARAATTATGTVSLGSTATASAPAAVAGALALAGTASATTSATSTGTVTLGGSPVARAATTAAGTVTLGGTANVGTPPATASGGLSLGGTATATAAASGTGTVTLSGTATGQASASLAGVIVLSGTANASGPTSAAATATGTLSLGGVATARVPATAAGLLTLSGLANGQALGPQRDLTITAALGYRRLTASGASRSLDGDLGSRALAATASTRTTATHLGARALAADLED